MDEVARSGSLKAALAQGERLLGCDPTAALEQAREILRIAPYQRDALWLAAAALRSSGNAVEAARVEQTAIDTSGQDPDLVRAGSAIGAGRLREAEHILRPLVHTRPRDAVAIRMLAEIAMQLGIYVEAEAGLRRALTIAPGFADARAALATALMHQNRPDEALEEFDTLLAADPGDARTTIAKAQMLGQLGEYAAAIECYDRLLQLRIDSPRAWLGYGNILKTVGRREGAIAAYRRALTLAPAMGEAWWSLANLKTWRFDARDIAAMQAAASDPSAQPGDLIHLHFALGEAYEVAREFEASFGHYSEANRLRRLSIDHDAEALTRQVSSGIALHTRTFFDDRKDWGDASAEPIFIIGMPRAGSTLIEQILSSHSAVEGTAELPDIPLLLQKMMVEQQGGSPLAYPEITARLGADAARAFGKDYLSGTRLHRKAGKPFFIDKLPNNWLHISFIHLILPNARIIDARRDPLDCCFSNFKQHFARGQAFSYSLDDMGRYYRDYVRLMDHVDQALPGRVHRMIHEELIADPEREIRRMLAALDLPFEEACLHFHENARPVRTASSEQVRRPINRDGVERWRAYEPWLGPLKLALGDLV
ncbi:tetratricopeptide (TPR) repeat protein [Sphingopyxis sp. OAS728]|uniref:tetratricopeptide repeat-containing sulfotransferase family protein n=1 Tax=Sphingopyxis sp. OAS728 TaxID=2663823 RepID=UPI00178AD5DD|nr:sulfotransferase [Sphingopyxis sp. OAS728]MBE1527690.1 tetratricopeptide (TPR) repeat protein [Sphingopyxis sp. OAS728]